MPVYFLQAADGTGPIKIGFTMNDPWKRVADLSCGSPVLLRLLGTMEGSASLERRLHLQFTNQWSHGEWYHPSPDLLALITPLPERERYQRCKGEVDILLAAFGCATDTELVKEHGYSSGTLSRWRHHGIPNSKRLVVAEKLRTLGHDVPDWLLRPRVTGKAN